MRYVPVEMPYEGLCEVNAVWCKLRVTDPEPVYMFRSCGRMKVAREPHVAVAHESNRGHETGYAKIRDLRAAGVTVPVRALDWAMARKARLAEDHSALAVLRAWVLDGQPKGWRPRV